MQQKGVWAGRVLVACVLLVAFAGSCGNDADRAPVMPAKAVPTAVEAAGVAEGDLSAWALFDRDTAVGWTPVKRPTDLSPEDFAAPP